MQSELILNPNGILNQLNESNILGNSVDANTKNEGENNTIAVAKNCWICYDRDKKEILIEPCRCKGDLSSVHQECLRRWLMQSVAKNEISRCEICKCEYNITRSGNKVKWKNGWSIHQRSISMIATVTICMCVIVAGCWTVVYFYNNTYVQIAATVTGLFVVYASFRFLGQNILQVYQRANVASLSIANQTV